MANRAAVVIHGIGQHEPYEMARALTDGLVRIARQSGVSATVEQIVPEPLPGSQTLPGRVYRVVTSAGPDRYVDVYEAYWAPLAAGLTSFLGIVWWLLINTFIPSRMMQRPSSKTFKILFDVTVSACCLAVIAVAYYWLFGALLQITTQVLASSSPVYIPHFSFDLGRGVSGTVKSLRMLGGSWTAPSRLPLGTLSVGALGNIFSPVTLLWLLATGVGVYALFQIIFRLSQVVTGWREFVRRLPANLVILGLSASVYLLALGSVTPVFFAYGYIYVVFRLVNMLVKKYFVDYIGDIEVYVSRDSKSTRFVAREQIRSRAVDVIRAALLSREDYDEVLVFGHSLGSVVGLDALRELRQQAGAALTLDQFCRLTAFVTFGSPLEKTRFFFDRISPNGGAQWVEFIQEIQQTFLLRRPLPAPGRTHRIWWYNFWYFADLIANSLESYNDSRMPDLVHATQLPHPGANPWVHSAYFVDDRFLRPMYALLI